MKKLLMWLLQPCLDRASEQRKKVKDLIFDAAERKDYNAISYILMTESQWR